MNNTKLISFLPCFCTVLGIFGGTARADIKLAPLFTDAMVLQRDMPVPVWGSAAPGEKVVVAFGAQRQTAIADDAGHWSIKLNPLHAGDGGTLTVAGQNTIVLKNVLVGEVWLCSGQSNMQLQVAQAANGPQEVADANYPQIRLINITDNAEAGWTQPHITATWSECSPESAKPFSAAAYFFGRDLFRKLNVPIGLIEAAYGGSWVESWTDHATLEATPAAGAILQQAAKILTGWQAKDASYQIQLQKYNDDLADAKEKGMPLPKPPRRPFGPEHIYAPSASYNASIAPLIPFAMRGVVWYQGESNRDRAFQYRTLFPAMIESWRKSWGEGDFPFLWVQLPGTNGNPDPKHPNDSMWAELREAQAMTLKEPKTGMAVAIDIGNGNIHPIDKQDVGHRLALQAEAVAYGAPVEANAPHYASMAVEGAAIRIRCADSGGGFVTKDGVAPLSFLIAGNDKAFVPADAVIDGDSIVVHSGQVAAPTAVRYAWADNPPVNLFGKNGLPVAPFRTDDWPGLTVDKQY